MTSGAADREDELRSYLLGSLPAERQEQIDEELIGDADVHAELQATADDLIHAYLAGELPPEDRERFETHFLASPRRRERVAFVRDLVSAVEHAGDAAAKPTAVPRRSWRASAVLPWAAALVVGLIGGAWSIGERRLREQESATTEQREVSLQKQIAERDARIEQLEKDAASPRDAPMWYLQPVERGQASHRDVVLNGSEVIKLRVLLDHDLPVKSYRASLQTAEGREILTMGGLKETPRPARTPDATSGVIVDSVGRPGPPYRILDVFVPTSALTPGAYLLSVRADTRPDDELTAVPFVVRPAAR